MKKVYKPFIFLIFLLASLCHSIDSYQIEEFYSNLSQKTLDHLIGKDKFIVKANVELTQSRYQVTYTKEANIKKKAGKEEKVFIMPGYSALKRIGPNDFNKLPYNSVTSLIEPKIKKINLLVYADKSIPRNELRKVKPILEELLELDMVKDKITIRYMDFNGIQNKKADPIAIVSEIDNYFSSHNILLLALIIILLIFLFIFSKKKSSQQSESKKPTLNLSPTIEVNTDNDSNQISNMIQSSESNLKSYFAFINNSNIKKLIHLLKQEKIPINLLSLILANLPSKLAEKVLQNYTNEEKSAIIKEMLVELSDKKETLEKLEERIKLRLENTFGGEKTVKNLLSEMNISDKESLFDYLNKQDPSLKTKLSPMVFLISDLFQLEKNNLTQIINNLEIETLAKGLSQENPENIDKIRVLLRETAKEVFDEYLENIQSTASKKEIEIAQNKLSDQLLKIHKKEN